MFFISHIYCLPANLKTVPSYFWNVTGIQDADVCIVVCTKELVDLIYLTTNHQELIKSVGKSWQLVTGMLKVTV